MPVYFIPRRERIAENYNVDEHYLTAMDRLEFSPVAVRIVPTHEYPTRFAESGEIIRPDEFRSLRKKIAKYGVRVSENGPRFIREHELKSEIGRVNKKYNRQLMEVIMKEHHRKNKVETEDDEIGWGSLFLVRAQEMQVAGLLRGCVSQFRVGEQGVKPM